MLLIIHVANFTPHLFSKEGWCGPQTVRGPHAPH